MASDPTDTVSLDYLVELADDGNQPDQQEPEVILLPPPPHDVNGSPVLAALPQAVAAEDGQQNPCTSWITRRVQPASFSF